MSIDYDSPDQRGHLARAFTRFCGSCFLCRVGTGGDVGVLSLVRVSILSERLTGSHLVSFSTCGLSPLMSCPPIVYPLRSPGKKQLAPGQAPSSSLKLPTVFPTVGPLQVGDMYNNQIWST